jgi:hypothetical protein
MAGETLSEFDIDLCEYILGQIRPHLRGLPTRPLSGAGDRAGQPVWLRYMQWERLDMPAWAGRVVSALPVELADHVRMGVDGEAVPRSLSDAELAWLAFAFDDPPGRLEGRCLWTPFPALHRRAVECVPEIRSELTQQTAEEWAADSAGFAARLCEDGLSLAGGIATVRDWLHCARRLLKVMGADHLSPAPGNRTTPTRANAGRTRRDDVVRRNEVRIRGADAEEEQTPEMLSPADIDAKYSISRSTVYAACRSGMLSHYRVPARKGAKGKYLVKEADLLAWLETLKSSGGPTPPSASAPASSRSAQASPFSELDPRRLAKAWKT